MVSVEYMVSYSQILEILKYIPKEDYNKIPKNMIELFENNCYKKSSFKYNPEKTLQEQNVTDITKTIIALLYRDYWAKEEQREKILKYQEENRINKKDINDIFKKENKIVEKQEDAASISNLPTVIKKENVFKRIINIIKNFFNKGN